MEWIKTEDRLPKLETPVLVVRLGKIYVGAIFKEFGSYEETTLEVKYWDDAAHGGTDWDWNEVTHWSPLPLVPGETE